MLEGVVTPTCTNRPRRRSIRRHNRSKEHTDAWVPGQASPRSVRVRKARRLTSQHRPLSLQETPFTPARGRRQIFNDPSAGSPTETLLRLLLPLSATVWSSFRQRGRVNRQEGNPRTSLKHSIGSSDGRCVQKAGT